MSQDLLDRQAGAFGVDNLVPLFWSQSGEKRSCLFPLCAQSLGKVNRRIRHDRSPQGSTG
jgi:hypothetical protein